MSWMQKLYETYEQAQNLPEQGDALRVLPISHISQQAHIEIVLDGEGNFISASVIPKEETLIPATEDSAGRSSGGAPHPLCDKIQYVAGDYHDFSGKKSSYFDNFKSGKETKLGYRSLLFSWLQAFPHPKLHAVLNYIDKRCIVKDLVNSKVLHSDEKNRLLTSWPDESTTPDIFKVLAKKKENGVNVQDQGDALVRWCVHIPGELETRTWKDTALIESWTKYDIDLQQKKGICLITGKEALLGVKHPARIRHGGDKAKLVSANDLSGYTFLGRFTTAEQACSIGYEVSQKAHGALRWLIQRQAFRNEDQAIVAWNMAGGQIASFAKNSLDAFFMENMEDSSLETSHLEETVLSGDLGQEFAFRLRKRIAGYHADVKDNDDIVVIGLDSSTPGRMAITYYRELKGSEFLARIEDWHFSYAWMQYYSKDIQFTGVASPKDIASAAFGRRIDSKLSKSTVERILPCIIDGTCLPVDLVRSTHYRAVNRVGLDYWEWEKILGIACGLFRGFHKERGYTMALETERNTRDYLYGRLLAVAERLEYIALNVGGENRDTNAAKLMQRFSERPYTTWLQIEQALVPYKSRLQSRRPAFLNKMKDLVDEIHTMFNGEDYTNDSPLSGEFLLGYHCQRRELRLKTKETED